MRAQFACNIWVYARWSTDVSRNLDRQTDRQTDVLISILRIPLQGAKYFRVHYDK